MSGPLQQIPATGGVPRPATTLEGDERGHARPHFLPDGRRFLFRRRGEVGQFQQPIYAASLGSTARTRVLESDSGDFYYSQGHLLFLRQTTLMAQPFELERLALTGEAVPVAERIRRVGFANGFAASANGVLAYQTGGGSIAQLVWLDRRGREIASVGEPAPSAQADVELSPDGTRALVNIFDPVSRTPAVWVYNLAQGVRNRLAFGHSAIWSPDGREVAFHSHPPDRGASSVRLKASSGRGAEKVVLQDGRSYWPLSWSGDGKYLLLGYAESEAAQLPAQLRVLPLAGDRNAYPFLRSKFGVVNARFSPDGRWVAYESDDSGWWQVYVTPFPQGDGRWQVSTGGGRYPRWGQDGKQIFYVTPPPDGRLMVRAVDGDGDEFLPGRVEPLFRLTAGARYPYDVSSDGQRFLVSTATDVNRPSEPITLVVNWGAGIKRASD
jgi:dipeptidyl aminopeptidase/acylaminoacyl peptidase